MGSTPIVGSGRPLVTKESSDRNDDSAKHEMTDEVTADNDVRGWSCGNGVGEQRVIANEAS